MKFFAASSFSCSRIAGTQGVLINAGRNLNIFEARNTSSVSIDVDKKKSSPIHNPIFMQNKAHGNGPDIGSDAAAVSTITSSQGGVLLQGGASVNLQGVQVDAAKDIVIQGGQVNISAAVDVDKISAEDRTRGGTFNVLGLHDLGKGIDARNCDTDARGIGWPDRCKRHPPFPPSTTARRSSSWSPSTCRKTRPRPRP